MVARDGKQSGSGGVESKSRERARGGKSEIGELSLCTHVEDKAARPRGLSAMSAVTAW
jgi:hypothetical protein